VERLNDKLDTLFSEGNKLVWKVKLDGNSMYIGVFPPSEEVSSRDE